MNAGMDGSRAWRTAVAAIALSALLAGPAAAQSTTKTTSFVDRDSVGGQCDDARTFEQSTFTTPWCTLSRAVQAAPAGTTVRVQRSTVPYPMLSIQGQERTAPVAFVGDAEFPAVVDGLTIAGSRNWRFQRLELRKGVSVRESSSQIELLDNLITGSGVYATSVALLRVVDNEIRDSVFTGAWNMAPKADGYGVRIDGASSGARTGPLTPILRPLSGLIRPVASPPPAGNVEIRDNTFTNIPIDPVSVQNAVDVLVQGNTMHDNLPTIDPAAHADAVQVLAGSKNVLLTGNRISHSHRGFHIGPGATGVQIRNNLFEFLEEWSVLTRASGTRIVSNTMALDNEDVGGNASAIALPDAGVTGLVIVNNLMRRLAFTSSQVATEGWNLVTQPYNSSPHAATTVKGSPNSLLDPKLSLPDFTPVPGSPAIDAGTSDHGTLGTDLFGTARFDHLATPNKGAGATPFVDIGAVEYSEAD